jgi:hypothetical protein
MPSQMSPRRPGMLCKAPGMAMASNGHADHAGWRDCCEKRRIDLKDDAIVVAESRGSVEDMAEAIRSCWIAAILMCL